MWRYDFMQVSGNDLKVTGITAVMDTGAFGDNSISSGVLDIAHAPFDPENIKMSADYADGYSNNFDYAFTASLPLIGLVHSETSHREVEVDGSGTLTTPFGVYDVLRLKVIEYTTMVDDMGGQVENKLDTSLTYEYWAKGIGEPVVEVRMNEDWTTTEGRVLMVKSTEFNQPPNTTATQELSHTKNFSIFPNPTKDQVRILLPNSFEADQMIVYNAIGKVVLQRNTQQQRSFLLSLGDLEPGMVYCGNAPF